MVSEVCPLFPAEGQMVTEAPEETPVETPVETQDEGWETYWGEQVTCYPQGLLCLCGLFSKCFTKGSRRLGYQLKMHMDVLCYGKGRVQPS